MAATAVDHEHGVTPRELFFDLVFVFAFTQVTTLLAHEPTWTGLGRAVLVLGALWWPWTGYAWLTNTVDPEEGFVGASLLVALIAMFLAALAVPGAFGDNGVLFGAAFLVVVSMHLALYALAGRGDPGLFAAVLRLAPWTLLGATLILVAGDVYAYAHLPMIIGIVLFAFAMKTIVGHVHAELDFVPAFALCGGSALYLLTYSAIRSRIERRLSVSRGRFVAALAILLLLP